MHLPFAPPERDNTGLLQRSALGFSFGGSARAGSGPGLHLPSAPFLGVFRPCQPFAVFGSLAPPSCARSSQGPNVSLCSSPEKKKTRSIVARTLHTTPTLRPGVGSYAPDSILSIGGVTPDSIFSMLECGSGACQQSTSPLIVGCVLVLADLRRPSAA